MAFSTPVFRTKQDLFEEAILMQAGYKPPKDLKDPKGIEEHRRSVLDAKETKHRVVFQHWPRDPKGGIITPENSCPGKQANEREPLWGATLFDLYSTRRIPGVPGLVTLSTGSKLAAWAKKHGEDYASHQLQFAEMEEEPKVIPPCSIARLIKDMEVARRSGVMRIFDDENGDNPLLHRHPKLEDYIPQHLLPKKLIVHDPWNILHGVHISSREKNAPRGDKEAIIRVYKLESIHNKRKESDEEQQTARLAAEKEARAEFLKNPHSSMGPKIPEGITLRISTKGVDEDKNEEEDEDEQTDPTRPVTPPIYVVYPPRRPPTQPEEAHLYLSPADSMGSGHHSFVYNAELEVPRSMLVEDELPCDICVIEDLCQTLLELDGPNGEMQDPKWKAKSGEMVWKRHGRRALSMIVDGPDGNDIVYDIKPSTVHEALEYEGPFRAIESKVPYHDATKMSQCEHRRAREADFAPTMTKVRVAAKLSIKHDDHLENEAKNYQQFPRDFFEHCSGYQLVPPMIRDPTPVGALVPQYYGYYVPDDDDTRNKARGKEEYLSPLLLLENCGKPISPADLTADDVNECASLVYRFHNAGWLHNSIYQRNILVQEGPLSDFPLFREVGTTETGRRNWSFRLIDFGRSYEEGTMKESEFREDIVRENAKVMNWLWKHKELDP